jgi:hypothetical protein
MRIGTPEEEAARHQNCARIAPELRAALRATHVVVEERLRRNLARVDAHARALCLLEEAAAAHEHLLARSVARNDRRRRVVAREVLDLARPHEPLPGERGDARVELRAEGGQRPRKEDLEPPE